MLLERARGLDQGGARVVLAAVSWWSKGLGRELSGVNLPIPVVAVVNRLGLIHP